MIWIYCFLKLRIGFFKCTGGYYSYLQKAQPPHPRPYAWVTGYRLQERLQELLYQLQEWLQEIYMEALKVLYNMGCGGLIY